MYMIVQIVGELCFYTDSKQVSNMHKSNHEKNVFSLVAIFLIFTYDKKKVRTSPSQGFHLKINFL